MNSMANSTVPIMRNSVSLLMFTAFALIPGIAFGACHVITPSGAGSKSGSDWNNACGGFTGSCAAASLTRGDAYYVGGGSGGNYVNSTSFSTPGSTNISITGATASDHCTATGWSSSYDVSVTPATFSTNLAWSSNTSGNNQQMWYFNSGAWTINGNTCTANTVYQNGGQGIKFDGSVTSPGSASPMTELHFDSGVTSVSVNCVDVLGGGIQSALGEPKSISSLTCAGGVATATTSTPHQYNPGSQVNISGVGGSGGFNLSHGIVASRVNHNTFTYLAACTNGASASSGTVDGAYNVGFLDVHTTNLGNAPATFEQVTIRESAGTPFQFDYGAGALTVDHSAVIRYTNTPTYHAEAVTYCCGTFNGPNIVSNSYFLDGAGTAELVPLYHAVLSNWEVFGNVFAYAQGNPNDQDYFGNGLLSCINSGTSCNTVSFYNNTCANINRAPTGFYDDQGGGVWSNFSSKNNVWYNCGGVSGGTTGVVSDHDTFLNTAGLTGTGDYVLASGAVDPFAADSGVTPAFLGFQLQSASVDLHLNDGTALSAPYLLDPAGNTRGAGGAWDRGAFQFVTGTPPPTSVLPPTGVTATAQ
jgi:hypothetical protein